MAGDDTHRSPELDQVRQLLFPELPADEGWARIDAALAGASDEQRAQAIERAARAGDLSRDLLDRIRRRDDEDHEDDGE